MRIRAVDYRYQAHPTPKTRPYKKVQFPIGFRKGFGPEFGGCPNSWAPRSLISPTRTNLAVWRRFGTEKRIYFFELARTIRRACCSACWHHHSTPWRSSTCEHRAPCAAPPRSQPARRRYALRDRAAHRRAGAYGCAVGAARGGQHAARAGTGAPCGRARTSCRAWRAAVPRRGNPPWGRGARGLRGAGQCAGTQVAPRAAGQCAGTQVRRTACVRHQFLPSDAPLAFSSRTAGRLVPDELDVALDVALDGRQPGPWLDEMFWEV